MKAILQRVISASVSVDGNVVGKIGKGYLILLGVEKGDTQMQADLLAKKTSKLRVFDDKNGNLNMSILDIKGETLVVSNFTLCADSKKGCRPSFSNAERPDEANLLYDKYCGYLRENGISKVEKGIFGSDMRVELINNGPVTIILDTKEL